jgi:hypothetical protein
MKKCSKCKEEKKIELFSKNKSTKDGLRNRCKLCDKEYALQRKDYQKNYYISKKDSNPELYKQKRAEGYIKNKEKIKIRNKEYVLKNKDVVKKRKQEWALKNKVKIAKKKREKYLLNKEEISLKQKEYRLKTKEKRNEYERNKNIEDPFYKFKNNVRKLISHTFKNNKLKKQSKTEDILGCSVEEFKNHIQSKFTEGMSFYNHGKNGWHLDHIIPISSAKTEEDVIKLNNYTNFQPLWAKDNLSKGNKIL